MTNPSATYISATRRKPIPREEVPFFRKLEDDYNQPGRKYPAANPAAKLKLNKMCADIALHYYNDKNDTKFEFVDETLDSYSVGDPFGFWIDCCFNAKDDSSIKHFSAEIQYLHKIGPDLTCFKILEGETEVGCCNCTHVSPAISKKEDCNVVRETFENVKDPKRRKTISDQEAAPVHLDIGDDNRRLRVARHKFNKMWADIALDYFNNKNDARFMLVETERLDSYSFSDPHGIMNHCCFIAKEDAYIYHFSAQIRYGHEAGPDVIFCNIVDGETVNYCRDCTHAPPSMEIIEGVEDLKNDPRPFPLPEWELPDLSPVDRNTWTPAAPTYKPATCHW